MQCKLLKIREEIARGKGGGSKPLVGIAVQIILTRLPAGGASVQFGQGLAGLAYHNKHVQGNCEVVETLLSTLIRAPGRFDI